MANPSRLGGSGAHHRTKPQSAFLDPTGSLACAMKREGDISQMLSHLLLQVVGQVPGPDWLLSLVAPSVSVPWGHGSHGSKTAHAPNRCVFLERADVIAYSSIVDG